MFDKFEVLMSWKLSWGLSFLLFGVSNGHIFFGFQIIAPYFRRSLHRFPFKLRLLADQPRVNGGRQQHQQYIIYRVYPLKIPFPSAPTIIKTKWPKTITIKTTTNIIHPGKDNRALRCIFPRLLKRQAWLNWFQSAPKMKKKSDSICIEACYLKFL